MYFTDQEVQFPSKNYYLLFDKQNNPKRSNLVNSKKFEKNTKNEIKESKPNWVLERKIKNLEKEVKELRQQN